MTPHSYIRTPFEDELPVTLAASIDVQFGETEALAGELATRMNQSWQQGRRVTTEEILAHHPELRRRRDAVLRLVCEEICLQREHGLTLNTDDWQRRFPDWRTDIEALFECQKLLDPPQLAPMPPRFLGRLHDFQLVCELGHGGLGQVYLATQPHLADRHVVVKVTPCHGREHLSLARLQHTHIVPLYWAQDYPDQNERLLCMPYYGNVTLALLLARLKHLPLANRTGLHILEVLDQAQTAQFPATTARGPARQLLVRATFSQAIVWMGACLADALAYAHERDLLHLDIKPSNVLWTTDGQPMLLDFHLARQPVRPDGPRPHGLGGTPMWMAPELETALDAVFQRKPVPCGVDKRADVFSLGLMLHYALGGPMPLAGADPPRLDEINSQVSPGLADIVRRCLARAPKDRYPDAEVLASDLRRHLSDLPLRGVVNRSVRERWHKWRRRQPHGLKSWISRAMMLLLAVAAGGGWWWQNLARQQREEVIQCEANARFGQAEKALVQAKLQLRDQKFELALVTLENGKALVPDAPQSRALNQAFQEQLHLVRREHAQQLLHAGVDVLRAAVVADTLSAEQVDRLVAKCRDMWERRDVILAGPEVADPVTRRDVIDLAVIWSELLLRQASDADLQGSRRQVVAILDEVENRCGASGLLDHLRMQQHGAIDPDASQYPMGRLDFSSKLAAWEHVARARQLLQHAPLPSLAAARLGRFALTSSPIGLAATRIGADDLRLDLAAWHVERALAMEPDHYWAHFYQGVAAYRSRRFADATAAFHVCIALQPRHPAGYHNRALAAAASGELSKAHADYTKALTLDPLFASAAMNRALIHVQLRDYDAALADLRSARDGGADLALVQANFDAVQKLRSTASPK